MMAGLGTGAAVGSARAQHYEMDMKKIIAYVNTVRVHWLVEELEKAGIGEILVTEYFSPLSKISRCEFLCVEGHVEEMREIVRRVGTAGDPSDHCFLVEDFDPDLPGQIPLGKRISKLEESRIKQLINVLLSGMGRKISFSFAVITLSIVLVGLFIHMRGAELEQLVRESNEEVWQMTRATKQIQGAMLQVMLAAEQLHRGERSDATKTFEEARRTLQEAVSVLKEAGTVHGSLLDSLVALHHQFQIVANGLFEITDSESSLSHDELMTTLNKLHLELMSVLLSLERVVSDRSAEKELQTREAISEVRNSLIALAALAIILSGFMWLWTERRVSRPLGLVVESARVIDRGELK